jgi:hypothetical protein
MENQAILPIPNNVAIEQFNKFLKEITGSEEWNRIIQPIIDSLDNKKTFENSERILRNQKKIMGYLKAITKKLLITPGEIAKCLE